MTTAELVSNTNEANRQEEVRSNHTDRAPLFDEREGTDLRTRWQQIQGGFVNDPRASVAKPGENVGHNGDNQPQHYHRNPQLLGAFRAWARNFAC